MSAEWMLAEAAINHVARALDVPFHIAFRELMLAAVEGRVCAFDRKGLPIDPNPRDRWGLALQNPRLLADVRFRRADIEAGFPPSGAAKAETPTPKAPPKGKHPGGAPTKYDWAGAAGYLAKYIVDNAPRQADAVAAMRRWFDERGKAPDRRELEKWVSHAFEEGEHRK